MVSSNETMHRRSRSKFRLPPPIDKDGRTPRVSQTSGINPSASFPLPTPGFVAKDSGISSDSGNNNGGLNGHNVNSNIIDLPAVLPGRPRRRPYQTTLGNNIPRPPSSDNTPSMKEHKPTNQCNLPITAAVLLWYLLGVVSISSSKVLLSTHNVPPLLLTLQQLMIGMTLLRTILMFDTTSGTAKDGLQLIPMQNYSVVIEGGNGDICDIGNRKTNELHADIGIVSAILGWIQTNFDSKDNRSPHIDSQLLSSSIYFSLGFLFTNYGFRSGSAAFVETIKAAEPITSAAAAVTWGIEQLSKGEVLSLTSIVVGVILSAFGQKPKADMKNQHVSSSFVAFMIVMISNLCFSFRGLHQKLFRASPQGKASSVNDLNLQFRMQQIGVLMLSVPALVVNVRWILHRSNLFHWGALVQYLPLALINGIAFTSYNLASTYVLTRISVVHHAALNCIRRVFAVIVTSVVFRLSITPLQLVGIATSVGGFFLFSHYKLNKGRKEKRRTYLRRKYGVSASKTGVSNLKYENKCWADEKKDADSAV